MAKNQSVYAFAEKRIQEISKYTFAPIDVRLDALNKIKAHIKRFESGLITESECKVLVAGLY